MNLFANKGTLLLERMYICILPQAAVWISVLQQLLFYMHTVCKFDPIFSGSSRPETRFHLSAYVSLQHLSELNREDISMFWYNKIRMQLDNVGFCFPIHY